MERTHNAAYIQTTLDEAVAEARRIQDGVSADYIPELANVDPDLMSAYDCFNRWTRISCGDFNHSFFSHFKVWPNSSR